MAKAQAQSRAEREETLDRIFKTLGEKYGYTNVDAEFADFREFKVQWQRSYRRAVFEVSDYVEDAGEDVIESLAETLFQRISGHKETLYGEPVRRFVTSDDFAPDHAERYFGRHRNLDRRTAGERRDLMDSVRRLRELGLWDDGEENITLAWSRGSRSRTAGTCGVLMRVIGVNEILDDTDIPDFVVDFVVYKQYLRVTEGRKCFGITADIFTRDLERRYPHYREAERLLDKLCLCF